MNEITICDTALGIKEDNGQRVVTFKDIDTVHQRPDGTSSRNCRKHRDKFIETTDYYILNQPDEIRRLGFYKTSRWSGKATNSYYRKRLSYVSKISYR